MLALSPPRSGEDEGEAEEFQVGGIDIEHRHHQFIDFGDGNLLDCIDFDDLFTEMEGGGDFLPDLEMVDPDILAEFSSTSCGDEYSPDVNASSCELALDQAENGGSTNSEEEEDEEDDKSGSESDKVGITTVPTKEADKGGKKSSSSSSSAQSKKNSSHPQGKRKVKVDWTPELHRRFVQAVEQLGLEKAVPSKILEIMGIECLTRHNIASHLQKYRSHRKHVIARESEAASWNHQRRHMYGGGKAEQMSPWMVSGPAMGFPPPMAPRPVQPPFRPLHVWGHPSADQSAWPRHGAHPVPAGPPPRPGWPPGYPPYSLPPSPGQPMDPNTYWSPHHHPVPNVVTPGRPHFAQSRPFTGLMPGSPVPGIPPNAMYKADPGIGAGQSVPQLPQDFHPSRETIDAAIGDALSKPWEPLPLGLKAPSVDGVLTELHRQGIANIPPSSPS